MIKKYGTFCAVDDISFSIKPGEIVGLLGPNGAGKTTTIQMLLALTHPTHGSISYFGQNLRAHREEILQRISYVSAYSEMQTRVTVWENLQVFALLYGVQNWEKKTKDFMEILGITNKASSLFWHLSSGEKARVNMAKALLNDPELILMDEPTASLDPEIVHTILDLVLEMRRKKNVAILYTSHNMGEVSRVCDRVIFLYHGKVIANDTPLGLSKRVADATLRLTFENKDIDVREFFKKAKKEYVSVNPHVISVTLDEQEIPNVLYGLGDAGVIVTDIEIEKPDLEDVFMAVAKGGKSALV